MSDHPITDALVGVTDPVQRQAIKVAAFVTLPNAVNVVTVGSYTVTLAARPVRGPWGSLSFNAKITQAGVDVTPPDMNPVQVSGAGIPILVSDSAGDITQTLTAPDGTVTTQTFREDLRAALLNIAAQLVAQL